MQSAFREHHALQCGFCTPGMLIAAAELVERNPEATRDDIRAHMGGNYCRCTGYQSIVDAIEAVSTKITTDQSQQPALLVGPWKPGSPPRGDHEGLMPSSAMNVSGSTGVQGFVFCTP